MVEIKLKVSTSQLHLRIVTFRLLIFFPAIQEFCLHNPIKFATGLCRNYGDTYKMRLSIGARFLSGWVYGIFGIPAIFKNKLSTQQSDTGNIKINSLPYGPTLS